MSSNIDKFINSSLSLAFFTFTSFSSAYCYSWGVALFHGFPWWHVEIGANTVARSLAWVFGASVILSVSYLLGYCLLKKCSQPDNRIAYWRVWVLVSVFSIPVALTFYLSIGKVPLYIGWIYVAVLLICMLLFHEKWNRTALRLDVRKLFVGQRWYWGILFVFVYFSLLSLITGYVRSDLRRTYDVIKIGGKKYYVLLISGENAYILGEKTKGNREFVFFNRENREHYKISVVNIRY